MPPSQGETHRPGRISIWVVFIPPIVAILLLLALNEVGLIPYPLGLLTLLVEALGTGVFALLLKLVTDEANKQPSPLS